MKLMFLKGKKNWICESFSITNARFNELLDSLSPSGSIYTKITFHNYAEELRGNLLIRIDEDSDSKLYLVYIKGEYFNMINICNSFFKQYNINPEVIKFHIL